MKIARVALATVVPAVLVGFAAPATAAAEEQVTNGGFEAGPDVITATGWSFTSSGGFSGTRCPASAGGCNMAAHSGDYFGVVGPYAGTQMPPQSGPTTTGTLSQVVAVPSNPVHLQFSYRRTDTNSDGYDTDLTVTLAGNVVATFTDSQPGVWSTVDLDLPPQALADQATLAFSGSCTNVTFSTKFCDRYDIDDVSLVTGADSAPPDTTITQAPASVRLAQGARKAPVKIRFTSTEPGSTFECKQDAKAWAACTSPHTFRLTKGSHTLRVRATDPAGNVDPSPAKVTVQVKPHR